MNEIELDPTEIIAAAEKIVNACHDFGAAIVESIKPLVDAFRSIAASLKNLVVFRLLPLWNYIQTHELLDTRFAPTPISIAIAEIYAPNAPPLFFALN